MSEMTVGKPTPRAAEAENNKSASTTLTAHGDGTYHTSPDHWSDSSNRVNHASLGAALAHMAKSHGTNDTMVIEGHDAGYTSHHVVDGKKHGPEEHTKISDVKKHVGEVMDCDE